MDTNPEDPLAETRSLSRRHLLRRALVSTSAAAAGAVAGGAAFAPGRVAATNGQPILQGTINAGTAATIVNSAATAVNARALEGAMTAASPGGGSAGVRGVNRGPNGGYGVLGEHAGSGIGVLGRSAKLTGVSGSGAIGVYGTGSTHGVFASSPAMGLYATGSGAEATGVEAHATYGVVGHGTQTGVYGNGPNGVVATATVANAAAVHAISTQSNGIGVYGKAATGVSGEGTTVGVTGHVEVASGGAGVYGSGFSGVEGHGGAYGVLGDAAYWGIHGKGLTAIKGIGRGSDAVAVEALGGGGARSFGVWAYGGSGAGSLAGYFKGNVLIAGNLSKSGGSFLIDHPLDPANRYLAHSFVESPDMLNVYSGTATLDARGTATVRLPRYHEALNSDHRYQLTAIGAPAPDLHVARKIEDGRFTIAGGRPGQEVCWQVTGIRQDAWARKHRIKVDYPKPPAQRGKYLNPEVHGKRRTEAIGLRPAPKLPKAARTPRHAQRPPDLTATREPRVPRVPTRARAPRVPSATP